MEKILAMKLLEGKKVGYTPVTYPTTERDAVKVAEALGVPPPQLYKTLVVIHPTDKPLLVMVPGPSQLDLKKLAKAVGTKKLKMATHEEAQALTGLQVGGISALAVGKRPFRVYLDTSAKQHQSIYVSAGQRGINLKVEVKALLKVVNGRWVDTI